MCRRDRVEKRSTRSSAHGFPFVPGLSVSASAGGPAAETARATAGEKRTIAKHSSRENPHAEKPNCASVADVLTPALGAAFRGDDDDAFLAAALRIRRRR